MVAKFYVLGLRTCFQSKGDQGCFSVSKDSEGRDVVLSPVSIIPKGIITFFITMNTKDDTINDHLGNENNSIVIKISSITRIKPVCEVEEIHQYQHDCHKRSSLQPKSFNSHHNDNHQEQASVRGGGGGGGEGGVQLYIHTGLHLSSFSLRT